MQVTIVVLGYALWSMAGMPGIEDILSHFGYGLE